MTAISTTLPHKYGTGVVVVDQLWKRLGPGMSYSAIDYMNKGDTVTVYECVTDGVDLWVRIADGDVWAAAAYRGEVRIAAEIDRSECQTLTDTEEK